MQVKVKCFAWAREVTGEDEIELEIPEDGTVAELRTRLGETYPAFANRMESIAVSVNHEFAGDTREISAGDELALIPPISGGCS